MTSTANRIVWLFLALAVAPAAAVAGNKDEAKVHVANAARAHKEARYEDARVELEAAYALDPDPNLLYAIGQVHAKLGNCRAASMYFRRFAATQNDPRVARVVDQAIAACKPAPAGEPPPPAHASPAPEPPAPPEPLGAAELPPDRSGAAPSPPPAAAPRPFAPTRASAAPPATSPPHPAWYRDKLGDGLVLGGVAAAIVGVIEYRRARADLDAAEDRTNAPTIDGYHALIDRAHGERTAAIVLAGAGGALIAAGVVRYVLQAGGAESHGVAVAPARGGGMVTYQGSF